jgi:hypothetical protein
MESHTDLNFPNKSYAKVLVASSWKTKEGTRRYSDWICRFKSDSLKDIETLTKGDLIICDGSFTREGYEKDGKKVWGDANMTVFSWKKWVAPAEPTTPLEEEDEYPF